MRGHGQRAWAHDQRREGHGEREQRKRKGAGDIERKNESEMRKSKKERGKPRLALGRAKDGAHGDSRCYQRRCEGALVEEWRRRVGGWNWLRWCRCCCWRWRKKVVGVGFQRLRRS